MTTQQRHSHHLDAIVPLQQLLATSLGPRGLDKLMQDDLGRMTFSNDGATILSLCPWRHATCKMLRDVALSQDEYSGDGTTSVVLLACELLRRMRELLRQQGGNIDLEMVLRGLILSEKHCVEHVRRQLQIENVRELDWHDVLLKLARSSLQSKILSSDLEYFASIAVQCVEKCFPSNNGEKDAAADNDDNDLNRLVTTTEDTHFSSRINVIRSVGNRLSDSFAFHGGYMMEHPSEHVLQFHQTQNQIGATHSHSLRDCRVCLLDFEMSTEYISRRTLSKIEMEIANSSAASELDAPTQASVSQKMWHIVEESGADVVLLTTRFPIERFLPKANTFIVDCVARESLYRIASITGGTVLQSTLGLEVREVIESLGTAGLVEQRRIGQKNVIGIATQRGTEAMCRYSTIVVRGSSDSVTAEAERSLYDSLSVTLHAHRDRCIVPGGGAVEFALHQELRRHALTNFPGKLQLVLEQYADALLVIPRTLALSCASASQAEDIVARLKIIHAQANDTSKGTPDDKHFGVDVLAKRPVLDISPSRKVSVTDLQQHSFEYRCSNMVRRGVLENMEAKVSVIELATQAAALLLRINETIYINE